eukprot:3134841-Amphidinium_carterae.1
MCRLWHGWSSLSTPLRGAFSDLMRRLHHQSESRDVRLDFTEKYNRDLMFQVHSHFFGNTFARALRLNAQRFENASPTELQEVEYILSTMWAWYLQLQEELVTSHGYYNVPPWSFVLMLHPEEGTRSASLLNARKEWENLVKLEALAARGSTDVQNWLRQLVVPQMVYVREVYLRLYEAGWQLTEDLREDLELLVKAHGTTLGVENLFSSLKRECTRQKGSGATSHSRLWHCGVHSSVHSDFDRPTNTLAQSAGVTTGKINAPTFTGENLPRSLSDDAIDEVMSSSPTWATRSPHSLKGLGAEWQLMMHHDGDWALMQSSWQSCLGESGTLMLRSGTSYPVLVYSSSVHRIYGWVTVLEPETGTVHMKAADSEAIDFDVVLNPEEWTCWSVIVEPIGKDAASTFDGALATWIENACWISTHSSTEICSIKGIPVTERHAAQAYGETYGCPEHFQAQRRDAS